MVGMVPWFQDGEGGGGGERGGVLEDLEEI